MAAPSDVGGQTVIKISKITPHVIRFLNLDSQYIWFAVFFYFLFLHTLNTWPRPQEQLQIFTMYASNLGMTDR